MSVQLALLKSGEEVIADIKEIRNSENDELVSYVFNEPYTIKIKTSQLLVEEEGTPKHEVIYYKWMSLSKDSDIIVNKDWIVCITDPIDQIKKSYMERLNGRNGSSNGRNDSATRRSNTGAGTTSNSSSVSDEQPKTGLTDC